MAIFHHISMIDINKKHTTRKDKHLLDVYVIINKINNWAPCFRFPSFLTHLLESEEAGQSISAHALSAFSSGLIM